MVGGKRKGGAARRRRSSGDGWALTWVALALALLLALGAPPTVLGQRGPLRDGESAAVDPGAAPSARAAEGTTSAADTKGRADLEGGASPGGAGGGPEKAGSTQRDGAAGGANAPGSMQTPAPGGSVRAQGRAAAVGPGDGAGNAGDATKGGNTKGAVDEAANPSPGRIGHERAGARVWPLPVGEFQYTQPFGCVPQLNGFYSAAAGCPASAPVFHTGIDLAASQGTRFYAAASGWVTQAGLDRDVGLANTRILVQHDGPNDGFATEYLHWITAYVKPGQYVHAGQPIGEVGSVGYSTGPHLHFGVIDLGSGETIDPTSWLPRDRATGAYLALPRDSRRITFDNVSKPIPDYADPAPPAPPRRERVPKRPPTTAAAPESATQRTKKTGDRSVRETPADTIDEGASGTPGDATAPRRDGAKSGPGGSTAPAQDSPPAPDQTAGGETAGGANDGRKSQSGEAAKPARDGNGDQAPSGGGDQTGDPGGGSKETGRTNQGGADGGGQDRSAGSGRGDGGRKNAAGNQDGRSRDGAGQDRTPKEGDTKNGEQTAKDEG